MRLAAVGRALLCALIAVTGTTRAESAELRISKGYGIHYLPLYIMQHEHLLEEAAKQAGLGDVKVSWPVIDGGNNINDAMLAGALDIAALGVPGYLTLWSKAKGNARLEVIGLAGIGAGSLYLNTNKPTIKTLRDFTAADKIALPGIKTSFAAVILEMVVAKEFGDDNYAKLDPLTVGMPYPEATAALISGKTEIDAHVASPPFSFLELEHPNVHRVFNSVEVLGKTTVIMAYTTRAFYEKHPRLCAAFIAAVDDATTRIAADKRWAAHIYNEMAAVKSSDDDVLRILEDPDLHYTVTPEGIMEFASFMKRVGTIKNEPKNWQEVFVPDVANRPGS